MLVLQDYEAITPNLLARTIETVEGGGIVVLLLKTMSSLKQLYSLAMVSLDNLSSPRLSWSIRMSTLDIVPMRTNSFNLDLTNDSSSHLGLVQTA